jgi:hypothetical protein
VVDVRTVWDARHGGYVSVCVRCGARWRAATIGGPIAPKNELRCACVRWLAECGAGVPGMTADTYTFYSPSAGDWVTKCATCGAWWLAGSGVDVFHSHGPRTYVGDPHPSEGCGLCGWDGATDATPCPSHAAEVVAWDARHGVTA